MPLVDLELRRAYDRERKRKSQLDPRYRRARRQYMTLYDSRAQVQRATQLAEEIST